MNVMFTDIALGHPLLHRHGAAGKRRVSTGAGRGRLRGVRPARPPSCSPRSPPTSGVDRLLRALRPDHHDVNSA